jgi:hypothetical protein
MSDFKIVKLLDSPVQINMCITPKGVYNNAVIYSIGDLVSYNGLSYIAIQPTVGNLPTDTTYWQLLVDVNISGSTWNLAGNTATNPSTDFLGTTDNQPLKIRTNNNPIAQFDESGRFGIGPDSPLSTFHLKPFVGYNGSGLRIDSFALTTSDTLLNNIYALTLTNGSIVKVTIDVTGRQSDGLARASFTRSALFYKEGGNVLLQGKAWQSDFTSKSDSLFDIKYTLGTNTIMFKVKAANAMDTYWTGNIKVEVIKTNT